MTTSNTAQVNNNNNNNNNKATTTTTMSETLQQPQSTATATKTHCIGTELINTTTTAATINGTTTQQHTPHITTTNNSSVCVSGSGGGSVGSGSGSGSSNVTNRIGDEDFNIRFVNLVRMHRCLYDKKVPEYRNRDNQEKAWALISQETRESVIHCKERWRNLRACLSRYIKQQSGSEPQHKPYYLTEHMAFLLPFLKSARNSLEGNNNLAVLHQLSLQHHQQQQHEHNALHLLSSNSHLQQIHSGLLELKHSLSENDDEETIDAFDPAITNSLILQQRNNCNNSNGGATGGGGGGGHISPTLSDTASANTLQNFIPDVQLAESAQDIVYVAPSNSHHHHHQQHHQQQQQHIQMPHSHTTANHLPPHLRRDSRDYDECTFSSTKRIKTECEPSTSGQYWGSNGASGGCENTDMEFFRSILPDIAALTPQQKRKFKIGILELIDDVVERFPASGERHMNGHMNGTAGGVSAVGSRGTHGARRNSTRDWH